MKRPWMLPLVPLYAAGVAVRSAALRLRIERVRRLALPVVSVGSLSAGGAGKTPFVIALARLLKAHGVYPDVLSRGYGRIDRGPAQVKQDGTAAMYGDEPLLIAREAEVMTYVAAHRYEAGVLAESLGSGAVLHLLDDGFQHRQLARDVDICLVSSEDLRDALLPAGNLREGRGALRRPTVFAVLANDDEAVKQLRTMGLEQPVWRYGRKMAAPEGNEVAGSVVAFCGIARPAQFFAGLETAGIAVVGRHAFQDHHRFDAGDIVRLQEMVRRTGASALVTTAKDYVRLGPMAAEFGVPVHVVGLRVVFEDEAGIIAWLRTALKEPLFQAQAPGA